jgi:hypothetical protein
VFKSQYRGKKKKKETKQDLLLIYNLRLQNKGISEFLNLEICRNRTQANRRA